MNLSFRIFRWDWEEPCAYCEELIKNDDDDIKIEKQFVEDLPILEYKRVWHNQCYEQYLDEGEE